MNITQIITNAVDNSVKNIRDKKFADNLLLNDDYLSEDIKQNRLLMNFSVALLESYHKALKEELSKSGIEI